MMKKLFFLLPFILFFSCTDHSEDLAGPSGYRSSEGDAVPDPDPEGPGNGQIQPGQITAGEWNDLENWSFWQNLMQIQEYSKMHEYWNYDLSNRISVHLENTSGEPLPNVTVELRDQENTIWTSKTDNLGNAELWPNLVSTTPFENLKVRVADTEEFIPIPFHEGINEIQINSESNPSEKIDLAFVVDATGSMGDELEYLKVELIEIIRNVKALHPQATINTGSVFYRDHGDDYVTRVFDFTTDINSTVDFIKKQSADGGGDFPEAVHVALNKSINELQWSANSINRIVFLLLDAPPHYEQSVISEIHQLVKVSAQKGIKIIPITASGIDKETEFLMRYLAISTNGTYVFITNHSGIGNDHLEASVGEYEVEYLSELLKRLIGQYLD